MYNGLCVRMESKLCRNTSLLGPSDFRLDNDEKIKRFKTRSTVGRRELLPIGDRKCKSKPLLPRQGYITLKTNPRCVQRKLDETGRVILSFFCLFHLKWGEYFPHPLLLTDAFAFTVICLGILLYRVQLEEVIYWFWILLRVKAETLGSLSVLASLLHFPLLSFSVVVKFGQTLPSIFFYFPFFPPTLLVAKLSILET